MQLRIWIHIIENFKFDLCLVIWNYIIRCTRDDKNISTWVNVAFHWTSKIDSSQKSKNLLVNRCESFTPITHSKSDWSTKKTRRETFKKWCCKQDIAVEMPPECRRPTDLECSVLSSIPVWVFLIIANCTCTSTKSSKFSIDGSK